MRSIILGSGLIIIWMGVNWILKISIALYVDFVTINQLEFYYICRWISRCDMNYTNNRKYKCMETFIILIFKNIHLT